MSSLSTETIWSETNCYTDLAMGLVRAKGHDPHAMLPFTLAIDFEGDQWTFFKPSNADIAALYGLDIQELAIWRPFIEHVEEQVKAGNTVLAEVDSFFLPDTQGTAYRIAHQKTTIGADAIDVASRRLGYFHNQGYFMLSGEDFTRLFEEGPLPPYVEFVKHVPSFTAPSDDECVQLSLGMMKAHLARAPRDNPFLRFKARLADELPRLLAADIGVFHKYSFATLRQYGACFELASAYLRWLEEKGVAGLEVSAAAFRSISESAKAFQFQLARSMSRKKPLDLAPLDSIGAQWDIGMTLLRSRYG
jgi:uncharacterized protein DUF1839